MKGVRHDIHKRRVLKKKSELLRQYGTTTLFCAYGVLGIYWIYSWANPKEYQSEEEAESKYSSTNIITYLHCSEDQRKFRAGDLMKRGMGYMQAYKDWRYNQK